MNKAKIEIVAGAIAKSRGNRRGLPDISNILDMLPKKLKKEVRADAEAVVLALQKDFEEDHLEEHTKNFYSLYRSLSLSYGFKKPADWDRLSSKQKSLMLDMTRHIMKEKI